MDKNLEIKAAKPVASPTGTVLFENHPSLFGYIVMLLSGGIALGLLIAVGYVLVRQCLGEPGPAFLDMYLYDWYLYLELSLLAFAALHLWAYMRTRATIADTTSLGRNAARVFLAIFLTILTVVVVSNLVSLLFVAKTSMLGTADYSTKGLWEAILGPLQAVALAGLMLWHFKRSSRNDKLYVVSASVLVLVGVLLLFIFPILSKRDATIDNRITDDLSAISASINTYVTQKKQLPNQLTQLNIEDKVKSRLENYEYQKVDSVSSGNSGITYKEKLLIEPDQPNDRPISSPPIMALSYKICATFKTDTTKKTQDIIPLIGNYPSEFSSHKTGKQCFTRSAYGGLYDNPEIRPTEIKPIM